jgi:asparagine synthase (glutamine-hydrolysing)
VKGSICATIEADGTASASVILCRPKQDGAPYFQDHDDLLVACDGRIAAEEIVESWRQWGADCPKHLYGDYAFFLHDRARCESFCARDHIGSRPLFYAEEAGRFACASDIPALLTLPDFPQELDEDFLAASQLERFFDPREGSFYRAIRRLRAGHCLHRTPKGTRIWRWWRPEKLPPREDISDDEAVVETRRLLEAAVADRLKSAGKVAVHLSGGIDSSLLAALVAPQTTLDKAYCWQDLTDTSANAPEASWIEAIRAQLGVQVTAPKLSAQEMADLLARDWARHPDARNLLHEAAVQRAAKEDGVTTIVSGWGGDEGISFHGRGHRPWLLATGQWRELWRIAERPGLRGGLADFYAAARRLARDYRPEPFVRRRAIRRSLLDPSFARKAKPRPEPRFREFGARATQIQLLQNIPTARIEDWAISGAEHGIEYVYPLLDRALIEFVVTLPPRMFVRTGGRRWLVRQVARGLIPELIRTNTSKDEAERGRQLETALGSAFAEVEKMLNAQTGLAPRARYFKMDRLRLRLAQAARSGSGRDKALRLAVQFLDINGMRR